MKLSIETYEIVTQLLIAEINDAKQNNREADALQAREALQEIDVLMNS